MRLPKKKHVKELFKKLHSYKPKPRGNNQMTLGSLIKALKRERKGLLVMTASGGSPGMPHIYAGHPEDLAFNQTNAAITVGEFLKMCESTLMKPNIGPDPSFTMHHSASLWMAGIGEVSKQAIIDVIAKDGDIQLVLKTIDE
jgi:hypothetical protein